MSEGASITGDPIYELLAALLHSVWERAPWSKMHTSWKRRRTDIFQHRLKKASYSGNLNQVIERLCKGLSIQSIDPDESVLAGLQEQEERVLHIMRTESVVLTLLAKVGPAAIHKLQGKQEEVEL